MTHEDITNALASIRPGAVWNLRGDTYASIEWLDEVQQIPSEGEIVAAIAAYVPPPTMQEQIATLQAQVVALLAAQH